MLRPALSLCTLALVVLGGCAAETDAPADRVVQTDSAGTNPAGTPEDPDPTSLDLSRIVTIGGPVTEVVYAVGLGANVVGTDRSSLYPEAVHAKPRLDYFRQTSAEGVLSLDPTLVIAVEGTGPPGVVEQIRTAGVTVVVLDEVVDAGSAESRVARLGRLLGREAQADSVAAAMRAGIAAAREGRPARAPRALFVYTRGASVVLASGTGNAADAVLRLAGAENAMTGFEGFRPLTAESVAAAAPDVIVVPENGLESLGGIDGLLRQPGLAQTPAGRSRRVVAVDDALLLGFGPRVGEGVRELARGLSGASADG